jgi:hypothetical protein
LIQEFIDSWQWGVFMAIITVYTLFSDDLRVIFLLPTYDDLFFFLTTVCLLLFVAEIIGSCVAIEGYFLGFFFWLDLLATASMLADIGWIMDNITNVIGGDATDVSSVSKTSRAARVTKIVRLVRLIRLIRIVKLYK